MTRWPPWLAHGLGTGQGGCLRFWVMQAPESSLSLYKTFSLPPSEETGVQDESRNPASKVWVFCTWLALPLPPLAAHNCLSLWFQGFWYSLLASKGTAHTQHTYIHVSKITYS